MKYIKVFSRFFNEKLKPNESGEAPVCCPFHDDHNPSMSINLKTGLWRCFACPEAGDVYTFWMKMTGDPFPIAKDKIDKICKEIVCNGEEAEEVTHDLPAIKDNIVGEYQDNLEKNKVVLKFLKEERGLSDKTIKKLRIGYNKGRITFPVPDVEGFWRNIRMYSRKEKGSKKVISWKTGYGKARILGIENLEADEVYLFEGEMDRALAFQLGYAAFTVTGGAGTWKEEWNELFKGKIVNICYDIDKAGQTGAENIARKLYSEAKRIKIIHLPITEPANADFSNYIINSGYSKKDFDSLVSKTKPYDLAEAIEKDNTIYEVHLSQASKSDYFHKKIKLKVLVAGKDLAPYIVPSKIKFQCNMNGKSCDFCELGAAGGEKILTFNNTDPKVLNLINVSDERLNFYLKDICGIKKGCRAYYSEILEVINIEELLLIPELDWSAKEQEYVSRRAYYMGHGLKPNCRYIFKSITVPDPKTQYATHIIYDSKKAEGDIINPDRKDDLKIFQPVSWSLINIKKKMKEISTDLSYNVTKIYGREDLHMAIDLVYHSVLSFNFQNDFIRKGYLELLILGDTRTGKSRTIQRLIDYYQLGEFVTGESASYAGLVGGLQQNQKRWNITWGKIPLNDRRMVIIDEASGLNTDEIGNMSGIRSSGIAELTKIQTERTNARTRLIWLSNPRSADTLNMRMFPVEFLFYLIGKPEDIARFDFVVSCASGEIPTETINNLKRIKVKHKYESELCKKLILWAWSRKTEHIHFPQDAEEKIIKYSIELGKKYAKNIPLIDAADIRIKLCRFSTALACRLFSTDDGENVIVRGEFVDFVYEFINYLYSKSSFKYAQYSEKTMRTQKIIEKQGSAIKAFLDEYKNLAEFLRDIDFFYANDLENALNVDVEERRAILFFLIRNKLIRKTSRGEYRKFPEFIKFLNALPH